MTNINSIMLLTVQVLILYYNILTITRYVCRTSLRPSGLSHRIARQILLFWFASDVSDLQTVAAICRTL